MDLDAFSLTLRLAALTTVLLLAIAMPIAWWLSTPGETRFSRVLRRSVQAVIALPLVIPPTVLGFYLLVGMAPTHALGGWFLGLTGHTLAFSFGGLVVGSMIYSLPFAVQPMVASFAAVDRRLIEVAAVLGASPWTAFRRITLPLARGGMLTAAVLTFAHTVGEFGVVLMIGGDIPGQTRTASIAIFDHVQEGNYTAANHAALLLVLLSFVALLLVYARGPMVLSERSR